MPSNVQLYAGSDRPIIDRLENNPAWLKKQWNRDDDGSLYRGYHNEATNQFVGSRYSIGAGRQVEYDAAHAAQGTVNTKDEAARTIVQNRVAATRPRMPPPMGDGTATQIERWLMALSWLLYRQE